MCPAGERLVVERVPDYDLNRRLWTQIQSRTSSPRVSPEPSGTDISTKLLSYHTGLLNLRPNSMWGREVSKFTLYAQTGTLTFLRLFTRNCSFRSWAALHRGNSPSGAGENSST